MTKVMPTFDDLTLAQEFYASRDYSDEFPTLESTEQYIDEEIDAEEKSLTPSEALEQKLFQAALGGSLSDERKSIGLGYVDTDPDPSPKPSARRLRRYWLRGAGALKIRWGTPGDFRRCVRQTRKHLGPGAEGYCNVLHKLANGYYPGDKRNTKSDLYADAETKNLIVESGAMRLENLFLSKRVHEGWERVEGKSGTYDVGYNILTDMWEAHDVENFNNVMMVASEETTLYQSLNNL